MSPGDIIDRYIIEAPLGEGGMARVYRVRHQTLGSQHALKILHPHLLAHEDLRQRFLAEGRIQARLRHPHLVPVTDIISRPGLAGLVMDLLEGEDLESVLQRGPVSAQAARRWTLQALSALSFVHGHGIVHRDIKPANLFIERSADGGRVRVMDFGIARVIDAARTAVTTQMGTVGYMSPEQIHSPKTVDARSDLFSLGAVLYEMRTGSAPFAADSAFSTQQRITAGRFPSPEGLPGNEVSVIRRALAVRREARFATAEDFAAALTPPPTRARAGRLGVAAACGAALAGLVAAMLSTTPPPPIAPIPVPDYPMVSVSPTTATLGSPASEGGRGMDESRVAITLTRPFAIGTTEVSQALYRSLMGENPSLNVGDALPVERVSWTDAARLANAMSAHHGLPDCYTIGVQVRWPEGLDCTGFRLPTEAEWELAARAGEDAPYASGTDGLSEVGWTRLSAGGHSHPVGQLSPNAWGIHDMHGNVAEWCWDRYARSRYGATDPLGAGRGRYRVVRGGSWRQPARAARSASRDRRAPSRRHRAVGIRLVRTLASEG